MQQGELCKLHIKWLVFCAEKIGQNRNEPNMTQGKIGKGEKL